MPEEAESAAEEEVGGGRRLSVCLSLPVLFCRRRKAEEGEREEGEAKRV